MTKTLYLIDGSGFIFRAYFAIKRDMTNPAGVPVKAVYGFISMMNKLTDAHKADYMAVIFDAGRKTFRNDIYPEYKAHRPPPPDDLIPQFALVREASRAMGYPTIEMEGIEADDIIASYATAACKQGMNVVIVSSDKDLMQLIAPGIRMYDAMNDRNIGEEQVREKFGVAPDKVLDVLSLIGDSSDNVPGVPGIGPKTAAELINEYGDLDSLLARAGEIKQQKRRETLLGNIEQAKLSRQLITLKNDVALPMPMETLAVKAPDAKVLGDFLELHGFKSLLARLQKPVIPSEAEGSSYHEKDPSTPLRSAQDDIKKSYSIVRNEKTLSAWIAKATAKGIIAFDTETTGLDPLQAELVGFSLCVNAGEACYVPLQHRGSGGGDQGSGSKNISDNLDLFSPTSDPRPLIPGQIPLDRAMKLIKPLLEDASVLKIGHNIKYDMLMMQCCGATISPIEDTMLISYVLHAGEHGQGMDELAERYLKYKTISYDEVTGTGKNRLRFDEVEIEKAGHYAAEDADVTMRMYEFFKPQLFKHHLLSVYETIERPLVPVLARMETYGIKVDVKKLAGLSGDFAARMSEYEKEICKIAGYEFNVGSPKQLGEILFDKLQLPGGKKSAKTGAYATDNYVLEDLAEAGHEIAVKVSEWRQLAKLKSTYSDSLPQQINPKTGRVHTNFAQAIASTGRLSSTDPNLQNIPIRTNEGKKIREAFIAEEGYTLLSADYSQIELRLLAHVADISTLKEAFRNGDDIHAITASQMFGVPVAQVNADLRRSAKTINFGIIYGISAHGLATRLGIGRSEAGAYIERYFKQYPGIFDYMESAKKFAREHGYVETLFGRRVHVPGIAGKGPMRAFSERAAINAPLQGTAADIIKKAMITLSCGPRSGSTGSRAGNPAQSLRDSQDYRMLLQVHDELVFEVKENALEETTKFVKAAMEQAAALSVPLVVETGSGPHWGAAH